jgi:CBS domain-containing protein
VLVRDVMAVPAVTCQPEDPLSHCARLLLERRCGAIVVTDRHGAALGIVTETDVMERPVAQPYTKGAQPILTAAPLPATSLDDLWEDLRSTPARRAMQRPVVAVQHDEEVERALELMVQRGIHRVPVLDGDVPVGMLSRLDVLRRLVEAAESIAAA